MENLFFPAVVPTTIALQRASFLILADEVTCLPLLANLKGVILEEVRLAAEVLPVVRVNTLGLIVLCIVRAPLSLKIKHVELLGPGHFVDQGRFYILVGMGE
jgi:hypothetical protein